MPKKVAILNVLQWCRRQINVGLVSVMVFGCCSSALAQVLVSSECEEALCKERLRFEVRKGVGRRSNSGVRHGYMLDYNRLQLWVNPRIGSAMRGITQFGVTVVGNRDSLGFDLVSGMQVD